MIPLASDVFDSGLTELADANVIHLCSSQPANYVAVAGITLASYSGTIFDAIEDASPEGRDRPIVSPLTVAGTGTGTATHYAIVDSVGERLLVSDALSAPVSVASGSSYSVSNLKVQFAVA